MAVGFVVVGLRVWGWGSQRWDYGSGVRSGVVRGRVGSWRCDGGFHGGVVSPAVGFIAVCGERELG